MPDTTSEPIPSEIWRIAGVIVLGAFMAGLDTSLVNVGLTTIAAKLHGSLPYTQWVSSGYLIALAAALPACGGWDAASARPGSGCSGSPPSPPFRCSAPRRPR